VTFLKSINIFVEWNEFIDTDPRVKRTNTGFGGYNVNAEFQHARHQVMMPPDLIQGLSVLDLGCAVGATGAWALTNGATRYVGVELQKDFCNKARTNLTNRLPNGNWEIKELSLIDFFNSNTEKFDFVSLFGVIYQGIFFEDMLRKVVDLNPTHIAVDSNETIYLNKLLENTRELDSIKKLPLVEYVKNQQMVGEELEKSHVITGASPNFPALEIILSNFDFSATELTEQLRKLFPVDTNNRYYGLFSKNAQVKKPIDFETSYTNPDLSVRRNANSTIDFGSFKDNTWKFNSEVAGMFVKHARQHIPNYDEVIARSVQLCIKEFKKTDKIIDVGCATGETLKRLNNAGFQNLVGVDSSEDMLSYAKKNPGEYILSNLFPIDTGPYSVVICNWTLHFVKDKLSYLQNIYRNMLPGGMLILSDKTVNDGVELELYHDFKRRNGVTETEIINKARSVQEIMFVNPPEWYFENLKAIGFTPVRIINAHYCFTTFLARK